MDTLKRLMTDSRFHTFLAVTLLGYIVWNYGPLLHIGEQQPFAAMSNRLISLVALAFLWGLTNIRTELNPFKTHHHFDIQNQIKIISHKLKEVQKQIKKDQKKGYNQQPTTHWHLVIGPCHSGKTNLLNSALDTDQDRNLVTATQDCAIWQTADNVYIELGEHFLPNHNEPDACRLLFQEFLKLCDRLDIQFHNIVVAIAINQVMTNTVDVDITRTHQMLTVLIAQNPRLPISIVFTKCDQMAGFTAFFCDLPMDERDQYCGIRLPFGLTASALKKTINTHLQQLNRRFHDRLLSRLQEESHLMQRSSMHDFPYQFELFCTRSLHFLNELLPDCDLNVTGLFFTSSQQTGFSINHLTSQLAEVFCLQKHAQVELYTQQTPYFTTELCQHLLPSFAESATHFLRPRQKMNPLFIPIIITSILGLGIYHLYSSDIHRIELASNALKNAQVANTQSAVAIAQKLTALESSIKLLDGNSTKIGHFVRPGHPHKLINQARAQYDNLVKHEFVNALDHTLQLKLQLLTQEASHDHLADLYDTLKITLLLQRPELADTQTLSLNQSDKNKRSTRDPLNQQIFSWFAAEWQRTIADNNLRQMLLTSLSAALRDPLLTLPSDPALVDKARQILTSSTPDNIIYTILENENRKAPLIISDSTIASEPIKINALYTRTAYRHIIREQIPTLCEKFAEGDWVLGYNAAQSGINTNTPQLIQALKTRYLNNYLSTWQTAVTQLHFTPTLKYNHLISLVKNLNSLQSPIIQFVQTVQVNTAEQEGDDQFNEIVAEHFSDLNNLSLEDTNDPLRIALENFSKYLEPMAQSNNPPEMAFKITKTRLSNPSAKDDLNRFYEIAKNSPEPLKSYLTALADNGWHLIISDSRTYISSVWANIVLPEYQQHLHNRYPLFSQANSEMSLDEFAHFFAPDGTIDTFFKQYVQVFLTNTDNGWQWKTMNGQQVALSDDALAAFIRAKLIQKMFFADGHHHPAANFTLTPTALNADLKNFTITLNGQRVDYHGPNQPPEPISWPGPHQSGVFIEVADNADQKNQVGYPGLWGMFHLLDKAQLGKAPSSSALRMSWVINEKRVDCEITSDNPINPFTPGILNQFRCPQSLT
jgi:type VI protein secretion system component VasK